MGVFPMMKKQESREMSGEEPRVKTKALPKKLRCLRECDMPGVGLFQAGDVIEDAGKIRLIADNPNFEQEEKL
jgi:hypothetical protein